MTRFTLRLLSSRPVSTGMKLGGYQWRSGRGETKYGKRTTADQPMASHLTGSTMPAHELTVKNNNNNNNKKLLNPEEQKERGSSVSTVSRLRAGRRG
jgi:hypothetical protein